MSEKCINCNSNLVVEQVSETEWPNGDWCDSVTHYFCKVCQSRHTDLDLKILKRFPLINKNVEVRE